MAPQLPLYRHPTLTVLIDDELAPLGAHVEHFRPALAHRRFDDAADAVAWMESSFSRAKRAGAPVQIANALFSQAGDLERIYNYVEDPRRFCTPTVVVVEYNRPNGSGMEACEAVSHLPCKKVWLSSVDANEEVVEAFNRGLIDRFVRRGDDASLSRLNEEIEGLQDAYFLDRSRELHHRKLEGEAYGFLRDAVFNSLVRDLMDRYGFVEHYLFATPIGLLFFDADGAPMLMVVQTEAMMVRQFERARDRGAPAELLRELFECRVVPFFPTGDGLYSSQMDDPMQHCRTAMHCLGQSEYYWALFEVPASFRDRTPFSHAQFMKTGAGIDC
jgi:hypothetical protein